MVVRPARSRVTREKGPPGNSASGSGVKRCGTCVRVGLRTKEVIHNGLTLLRVRYGLPYSELPDVESCQLGRYLGFLLLQGKERASVVFPRRQRPGKDGLCSLQRLRRHERWELAHGVSSIKRNLPAGCARCTPSSRGDWESLATSQPSPSSPEYLSFVKAEVTRLFPSCWDRDYGRFVGDHLPNPTSRACRGRADQLWAGRRSEFLYRCLYESDVAPEFVCRYKEVLSAGKKRPLLIYPSEVDLLAPLHKLLYSRLMGQDWLLCGPPTEGRMTSVCVGEYQTSVDLVSATDGLCHDVTDTILDALFFTSVKVPRSIRSLAYASYRPFFKNERGKTSRVSHGQMMGAYLSFPLLCLHSYVAARWATRDVAQDTRILVNGDDCVISSSRVVAVQDYPSGYRLNNDKTIRARNVVEVNSTCFLLTGGKWRRVRHLRRGGAPTDFAGMQHMAKAVLDAGPAFVDAFQRARIGRRWGFLPSQLGHKTYPAYLREQGMWYRSYTPLPEPAQVPTSLQVCFGTPGPYEVEVLRSHFWSYGREGGSKRDVFSPSCGKVRRSYSYRAQPCKYRLSFVGWVGPKCALRRKAPDTYLVPESFVSEEEDRGLRELELWHANCFAGLGVKS